MLLLAASCLLMISSFFYLAWIAYEWNRSSLQSFTHARCDWLKESHVGLHFAGSESHEALGYCIQLASSLLWLLPISVSRFLTAITQRHWRRAVGLAHSLTRIHSWITSSCCQFSTATPLLIFGILTWPSGLRQAWEIWSVRVFAASSLWWPFHLGSCIHLPSCVEGHRRQIGLRLGWIHRKLLNSRISESCVLPLHNSYLQVRIGVSGLLALLCDDCLSYVGSGARGPFTHVSSCFCPTMTQLWIFPAIDGECSL